MPTCVVTMRSSTERQPADRASRGTARGPAARRRPAVEIRNRERHRAPARARPGLARTRRAERAPGFSVNTPLPASIACTSAAGVRSLGSATSTWVTSGVLAARLRGRHTLPRSLLRLAGGRRAARPRRARPARRRSPRPAPRASRGTSRVGMRQAVDSDGGVHWSYDRRRGVRHGSTLDRTDFSQATHIIAPEE